MTRIMRNQCKSLFAADGGHTRYWRHSHLPNVTFESIALISCNIQRNCISSFENLQLILFMCFASKKEYSVDSFCERWLWPPGYLIQCHNNGIRASKLNKASFSTDEINQRHREEEPQNKNSHKTSIKQAKYTSSSPSKPNDCTTRKGTKYCIIKQGPRT